MTTDRPPPNPDRRATAATSQLILIASTAIGLVVTLLTTAYVGRELTPSDYGFFALVAIIFTLGRRILNLGTSNIAARESMLAPSDERAIIEGLMGWQRLFATGLSLIVLTLALYQDEPRRLILAAAAVVTFFLYGLGINSVFQVRQAQVGPALVAAGSQLLVLAGCIGLSVTRVSGALFALLLVLREAVVLTGLRILARRHLGYKPVPNLHTKSGFSFLGKASTMGLATLMYHLCWYNGIFLVWGITDGASLGALSAALRPVLPVLAFPKLLLIPLVPVFAIAAARNRAAFQTLSGDILLMTIGVAAIVSITGYSLAPAIISSLYGGNYMEGDLDASITFGYFSVALFFRYVSATLTLSLISDHRERALLGLSAAGLALNISGNLVLVPTMGFRAVSLVMIASELTVFIGILICSRKLLTTPNLRSDIVTCMIPCLILFVVFNYLPAHEITRMATGVGAAILGIISILLSPTAKRHRLQVSNIKMAS